MKLTIYSFIVISCFLLSCKKEPVSEPNSGIYRGVFSRVYDSGDTVGQGVSVLSISASNNSFSSSGDTASGAPFSCYGDFSINGESEITFTNNANVDFGWAPYYILDTTWKYYFNDKKFKIWFRDDTALYQYNLKRI